MPRRPGVLSAMSSAGMSCVWHAQTMMPVMASSCASDQGFVSSPPSLVSMLIRRWLPCRLASAWSSVSTHW